MLNSSDAQSGSRFGTILRVGAYALAWASVLSPDNRYLPRPMVAHELAV